MTRHDLVREIAAKIDGCTQADVDVVLDTFEDVVRDILANNKSERIAFGKLGSFKVKHVNERKGVCSFGDKAGEAYTVPEHDELSFSVSKASKNL